MKTQILTDSGLRVYDQEMKNFIDKKLEDKVDSENGKGLSTNDYNDEEKNTVAQNKEDIEDLRRQIESMGSDNEDIINTTETVLENSYEGGLVINEIKGQSEQGSNPSASNQQTIKSASFNTIKTHDGTSQADKETEIELLTNVELNGIGNVCDIATFENITRYLIKVVFDGSDDESWTQSNGYLSTTALSTTIKIPTIQDTVPNMLCSMAKVTSMNNLLNSTDSVAVSNNGNLNIYNSYNSNVSGWKTFLQSNPMTVVYELKSPIIEEFPKADMIALNSLKTFEGTTYIEVDSEVKPLIDVDYGCTEIGSTALENYNNIRINQVIASSLDINNTITYSLSASDGKIVLTGSDGTTSSVDGSGVELDTTLTVSGKAADAKTVGDKLYHKWLPEYNECVMSGVGWHRIAKYKGVAGEVSGIGNLACDIGIRQVYANNPPESHDIKFRDISSEGKYFVDEVSSGKHHKFTKIRAVSNVSANEMYIDVYYNTQAGNNVTLYITNHKNPQISTRKWELTTGELVEETVDGFTVLGTHDFSLNKSYESEIARLDDSKVNLVNITYSSSDYENNYKKALDQAITDGKLPVGTSEGLITAGRSIFPYSGYWSGSVGMWIVNKSSEGLIAYLYKNGVDAEIQADRILTPIEVIDNLTSTVKNRPLSANQGRVLNETKTHKLNIEYTTASYQDKPWKCMEQAIADGKLIIGSMCGTIVAGGTIFAYQGYYNGTTGSFIAHSYQTEPNQIVQIWINNNAVSYKVLVGDKIFPEYKATAIAGVGWHRIAKFQGYNALSVNGAYNNSCDIGIRKVYTNNTHESHDIKFRDNVSTSEWHFVDEVSNGRSLNFTKIRNVYNATTFEKYIEVYYNTANSNSVLFYLSNQKDILRSSNNWELIEPELVEETVDGFTVLNTHDFSLNKCYESEIEDLAARKVTLHNIIYSDSAYQSKPWMCIEQDIVDGNMPIGVMNGRISAGGVAYPYQGYYTTSYGSWIVHGYFNQCLQVICNNGVVSYKKILTESNIVDNLTSTDATVPLSANQGRALDALKVNLRHVGYSDAEYLGKPWKVIENAIARGVMPTGSVCGQLTAGGNLYHYTGYYSGTYGSWLVHNYNAGINSCVQVWATSTGVSYKYLLGTTEVVNVLNNTATDKPLSANMGRELDVAKVNYTDIVNDLDTAIAVTDTQTPVGCGAMKEMNEKMLQIVSFDASTGTLITKSYDYTG